MPGVGAILLVVEAAVIAAAHAVVPVAIVNMMTQMGMAHIVGLRIGFVLYIAGTEAGKRKTNQCQYQYITFHDYSVYYTC